MGCPPVRGDNPRAVASGLSYVQVDNHGITILTTYISTRYIVLNLVRVVLLTLSHLIDVHILKMYLSATKKNMFKYTDECADPGIFVSRGEVGSRSI